jgi:GDP-L-fucose synthase
MRAQTRIYVAGHTGLAGSALVRALQAGGYANLVLRRHADLDLTDSHAVASFFALERPEVVFLAAARVGGILANQTYPAEFIQDNLAIQTNVIHEAWQAGVKRLLFLGSSCIYPRDCPQPIREDSLLTGPLEPTNRPYAIAKIAGVEMCWAHNRQYGTRYLCAMPTNLYGPGDNYDLATSHVLAALIRRFHDAKASGAKAVTLWGTGAPRREFLHSDDMAAACVHLMTLPEARAHTLFNDREPPLANVGCGEDLTIRELAELVRRVVDVDVDIEWDSTKPDGTPRKLLDVRKLAALGWQSTITLEDGVRRSSADFRSTGQISDRAFKSER